MNISNTDSIDNTIQNELRHYLGVVCRDNWLHQCCQAFRQIHKTFDANNILRQILCAHLSVCVKPCLPEQALSITKVKLSGPHLLQVCASANVSLSSSSTSTLPQSTHTNSDMALNHRTIKLWLNDGHQYIGAIEVIRCPALNTSPIIGSKILLNDVWLHHGHALLFPTNFVCLGGTIPALNAATPSSSSSSSSWSDDKVLQNSVSNTHTHTSFNSIAANISTTIDDDDDDIEVVVLSQPVLIKQHTESISSSNQCEFDDECISRDTSTHTQHTQISISCIKSMRDDDDDDDDDDEIFISPPKRARRSFKVPDRKT